MIKEISTLLGKILYGLGKHMKENVALLGRAVRG